MDEIGKNMENINLRSTFKEVLILFKNIPNEKCVHVYKERNKLANQLSKESLQVGPRTQHRWDRLGDSIKKIDQGPFY